MRSSARNVCSQTLRAVVTRADGRVEDLGVIASWRAPRASLWLRLLAWLRMD